MKSTLTRALFASILFCSPLCAQSGVPSELSYQATLTDDSGALIAPITPVNYALTIRIFPAASGGQALWSERIDTIVHKGRFSVILGTGDAVPINADNFEPHPELGSILDGTERFVEVTLLNLDVNGSTPKTFSTRQKLVATATALRAKVAESVVAGSITSASFVDGTISKDVIPNNAINSNRVENRSLTGEDIALGSLGFGVIADNAIRSNHLQDRSVTNAKLADNAVTSTNIANGSVTRADLAAGGGLPTYLPASQVKLITIPGGSGRGSATFLRSTYSIPSDANGIICKCTLQGGTPGVSVTVVFDSPNGTSSSALQPGYYNGFTGNPGASGVVTGRETVYIPIVHQQDQFKFSFDRVDTLSPPNAWIPRLIYLNLGVIGHY